MLLNKTKFEEIFKSISGIIIVIFIITSLSSCNANINFSNLKDDYTLNSENKKAESVLITKFQNNLKSIIENDLHNTFYVNYTVEIKTDLKSLKIYVYSNNKLLEDEITNYIKQKYCTSLDEVIIINENTNKTGRDDSF